MTCYHQPLRNILPLLISVCLLYACSNESQHQGSSDSTKTEKTITKETWPTPGDSSLLTVAAIRSSANQQGIDLLFNERAAIYHYEGDTNSPSGLYQSARSAFRKKQPLYVFIDVLKKKIRNFRVANLKELKSFHFSQQSIVNSLAPIKLGVKKPDSLRFSKVISQRYFRSVFDCTNVVPDMTTAKDIFSYCSNQTCTTTGSYPYPPCIPFQYVVDGCYARANKMRDLIQEKYGFCCEKVFSFANKNGDELSVKTTKWGGCCVNWWYHVAPILRIKSTSGDLIYVIDPGMFDEPVLLLTWLQAQKDSSCNLHANVSSYSIQPGTAYMPANYDGTAFSTDLNDTNTNVTLIDYRNLKTCGN